MFLFKSKKKKEEDGEAAREENLNSSPPMQPTVVDMPPQYAPLDTVPAAKTGAGAEATQQTPAEGTTARKKGTGKKTTPVPAPRENAPPGAAPGANATSAAPLVPATPTSGTAGPAHAHPKAKKKVAHHPSGGEAAKENDAFSSPVPPSSASAVTATPEEAAAAAPHAKPKKKHAGGSGEQTAHAVETVTKDEASPAPLLPPSSPPANAAAPTGIMTRKAGKSPQKTAKKNHTNITTSGAVDPAAPANAELPSPLSPASTQATSTGPEGAKQLHGKGRRKGAGGARVPMAKFVDVPDSRDALSVSTRADTTPVSLAQLRKAVAATNAWKHRDLDEENRVDVLTVDRDWGKSVTSQSNAATEVGTFRSPASSVSGVPTHTELESASTGKKKKKGAAAGGVTALQLQSVLQQQQTEPRLQDQALASTRSSRTETYADAVRQREEVLQLERDVNISRMQAFFQHHAPKLMLNADIAAAVEEAQQTPGGLAEMWQLLVQYYGPEPVQRPQGMFRYLLESAYRSEDEIQPRELRSPSPAHGDQKDTAETEKPAVKSAGEPAHDSHKAHASKHSKYADMFADEGKHRHEKDAQKPPLLTTTSPSVEQVRLAFSGLRFATYAKAETARQMAFHRAVEVQVSVNTGCHVDAVSVESIDPNFVVALALHSVSKTGGDYAPKPNPSSRANDSLSRLQGTREPSSSSSSSPNLAWSQLVEMSRTSVNNDSFGARRHSDHTHYEGRSASTTDPFTLAAVIHDCIASESFSCNLIRASYRDDLRGDVSYVSVASLINRSTLRHPLPTRRGNHRTDPRSDDVSDQESVPRSHTNANTYDGHASPILRVEQSNFSVGTDNDSMAFNKSEERYVPSLAASTPHHVRDARSQSPPATPPPSSHWHERPQVPSTARGYGEIGSGSGAQKPESAPRFDKPSRNIGATAVQTARVHLTLGEDIVSSSYPARDDGGTMRNVPQYSEAPTFIQKATMGKPRDTHSVGYSTYHQSQPQPQPQPQRRQVHVDAGRYAEKNPSQKQSSVRRMNEEDLRSAYSNTNSYTNKIGNTSERVGNTQPVPTHTTYVVASSPSVSVASSHSHPQASSYGFGWETQGSHSSVNRASAPPPPSVHREEASHTASAPAPVPVPTVAAAPVPVPVPVQPAPVVPGSNRQSVPPAPQPQPQPQPQMQAPVISSRSPSGLIARHASQVSHESAPPPPPPRQRTQTFTSFAPSVSSTRQSQTSAGQASRGTQLPWNAPVPSYSQRPPPQTTAEVGERSQSRLVSPWTQAISSTQK